MAKGDGDRKWQIGLVAYLALIGAMVLLWLLNSAGKPREAATRPCGWGVADPIACPEGEGQQGH